MNKILVLVALIATPSAFAWPNKDKTLVSDGVYAAGFAELGLDYGSVLDYSISNFRVHFGFQALRYEDYIALGLGYGKVGFYDALKNHDTKDGRFQLNYEGPLATLNFFPNYWIHGEFMYFIKPKGKGSERISDASDDAGADIHYRYDFEVSDAILTLGIHVWDNLKVVVGYGKRRFEWENKITSSAADGQEIDRSSITTANPRAQNGSDSGSYFLLGIRGTQM